MHLSRWMANIIAAFIPNELRRRRFRTMLRFDTDWCPKFVREYIKTPKPQLKTYVGNGCHNYVVVADKKYVFKFPIRNNKNQDPGPEQRITQSLTAASPYRVPRMEIIKHDNGYIKKYDYLDGVTIASADKSRVQKNLHKIAEQIARFLFALSTYDPADISDLKPAGAHARGFMYGWGHNDIGGNFILNPETMDIIGFIDWETATFGDLMPDLYNATHYWAKLGFDTLGIMVLEQYTRLWLGQTHKLSD